MHKISLHSFFQRWCIRVRLGLTGKIGWHGVAEKELKFQSNGFHRPRIPLGNESLTRWSACSSLLRPHVSPYVERQTGLSSSRGHLGLWCANFPLVRCQLFAKAEWFPFCNARHPLTKAKHSASAGSLTRFALLDIFVCVSIYPSPISEASKKSRFGTVRYRFRHYRRHHTVRLQKQNLSNM